MTHTVNLILLAWAPVHRGAGGSVERGEEKCFGAAVALDGACRVVGSEKRVAVIGQKYLSRQAVCLGGRTTEIARTSLPNAF
jgi:hypothetical protein